MLHAVGNGWESAFARGDVEAGYAVNRSFNDWLFEEWGYAHENRIFVPVPIPLVDVDRAVAELQRVLDRGAVFVDLPPGPAFGLNGAFTRRSTPYFDPFWNIVERVGHRRSPCTSAAPTPATAHEWSEDPNARYSEFNGFQWVNYWGDRPIMETLSAMVFHNLFGRFPNINVLIAEFGTVWLPVHAPEARPRHDARPPAEVGQAPGPADERLQGALRHRAVPGGEHPPRPSRPSAPTAWCSARTSRTPRGSPTPCST